MADDRTMTGNADDVRINVNEAYEVQYWSAKFGVTPEKLHDAVAAVGPIAADVRRELGMV